MICTLPQFFRETPAAVGRLSSFLKIKNGTSR